MGYLNKYRLLHEGQSGFRQKHSCQTGLIKLIDHWMECIDKGDLVGTLFVDFRKAFDLVNHSVLLEKLNLYKFSHYKFTYLVDNKQLPAITASHTSPMYELACLKAQFLAPPYF